MRKTRLVIRGRFPVLIACVLLLAFPRVFAQQNGNGPLGDILNVYQNASTGWITQISVYAKDLFLLLAGIEFAWTATILLLEQHSLEGWVAAFIRKLMGISFFYAVLINSPTWIRAIINSFKQIGQNVGGTGDLTADDIIGDGITLGMQMISAASKVKINPLDSWQGVVGVLLFGGISIVIIICFIAMALQFVMTQVEGFIVIGAGMIFLGFGGSRWTSSYVERFLSTAVTTGIRLMTFFLIIGLGQSLLLNNWMSASINITKALATWNPPAWVDAAKQAFTLGAGVIIFTVLALRLPRIAGGVVSGSAGLTTGDAAGTMASFAGVGAAALSLAAGPAASKAAAVASGAGGSGGARSAAGSLLRTETASGGNSAMNPLPGSGPTEVGPPEGPVNGGALGAGGSDGAVLTGRTVPGPANDSGSASPTASGGNPAITPPDTSGSTNVNPPQNSVSDTPSSNDIAGSRPMKQPGIVASVSHALRSVHDGLTAIARVDAGQIPETLPPPTQSGNAD